MAENQDKRNATQKIEDLEKVATMLYQAVAQLQQVVQGLSGAVGEVPLIKEAIKLLNRKSDAIIQAAKAESGISAQAVSAGVTAMNVDEMKGQVQGYLANGSITPDAPEVAGNSFIVAEEYNSDGTMANPRVQFRVDSQDKETTAVLIGKKVGDTVSFGPNRFDAKILEIYTLPEPKPAAPTLAAVPDAPAQEAQAPAATPDAAPAEATQAAPAQAEAPTPAETAPTAAALPALPAETPIVQFVPSTPDNMLTANS